MISTTILVNSAYPVNQCKLVYLKTSRDWFWQDHFDRLVQQRCNSSALAMELRLSCTDPSIWCLHEMCGVSQHPGNFFNTLHLSVCQSVQPSVCLSIYQQITTKSVGHDHMFFYVQLLFPLCRIYAPVNRVSIGSDNGLLPIQCQAII